MKVIFICLAMLAASFWSHAQLNNVRVQWLEQPEDKAVYFFGAEKDGNLLTAVSSQGGNTRLIRFGKELNQKELLTEFSNLPGEETFLVLPVKEGWCRVNQSRVDRDHQVSFLTVQDQKIIARSQEGLTPLPGNKFSQLSYLYSDNRSFVMVFTTTFNKKENSTDWNFEVYATGTGALVNKSTYAVSYSASIMESVFVSDAGQAVFVSKKYKNAMAAMKGRDPVFEVQVFQNHQQTRLGNFSITGYQPGGLNFVGDGKGTVFISGTAYPPEQKAGSLAGRKLFLARMDLDKLSFSEPVLLSLESLYPDAKMKRDDDIPVSLKKIHYTSSGDMLLVAEQQQYVIGTSANYWRANDIICFRLNTKGEQQAATRIARRSDLNGPTSLFSLVKADNLYLVYNDNKQNLSVQTDNVQAFSGNASKNGLVLVRLQPDGSFQKELLADYANSKYTPVFDRCFDLDGNRVFLGGLNGFGILSIQ